MLDPATDLGWWVAVAEEGEQAASSIRQPRLLAELLDLSARVYLTAGLWQAAETAWKRALYLMDKLNDDAEFTRYIEHLAATYRLADRPNYVLETLERLIEYHERRGTPGKPAHPDKVAKTQAEIAAIMVKHGNDTTAIEYLTRADRLLNQQPDTPELRIQRAVILADLGTAHARQGAITSARTPYRKALALVIDLDEAMEHRIRDLQLDLQRQRRQDRERQRQQDLRLDLRLDLGCEFQRS